MATLVPTVAEHTEGSAGAHLRAPGRRLAGAKGCEQRKRGCGDASPDLRNDAGLARD
jgi:hypothetical protein